MSRPDAPEADGLRRSGSEQRAIPTALLLSSLMLAAAGQALLSYFPARAWIGIVAFGGSFVLMFLLLRSLNRGSPTGSDSRLLRVVADLFPSAVGPGLLAAGLICSVLATVCSQARSQSARGWPSFAFWLTGVLALTVFVVRDAVRSRRVSGALALSRLELAGIIGLTACAFILRFVRLQEVPYPISGDEASVGLEGLRILAGTKVALPHLRSELDTISRAYPGGKSLVVPRRPKPREPLFFLYRLD